MIMGRKIEACKIMELYHGTSLVNARKILEKGFKSTADAEEHGSESGGLESLGDGIYFSTDYKTAANYATIKNTGAMKNAIIKVNFKGKLLNITDEEEFMDEFGFDLQSLNDFLDEKKDEGYHGIQIGDEINIFDVEYLNTLPRSIDALSKIQR